MKAKVISSHNVELDSKMGGGLPAGSLILVEGASGSGKSVLSQQILWGGLLDGYTAVVFTSENTVKSLISQMRSIDLDVLDYLLLTKLRIYPIAFSQVGDNAANTLLQAMQHDLKTKPRDLVIVDSFSSVMAQSTQEASMVHFFEQCKKLCARGTTILVTLHATHQGGDLITLIRSMCDAHLHLRSTQDGQRLVKTLEVAKIRGAASGTGAIVGFDVEPGWGMRVIPISKARG